MLLLHFLHLKMLSVRMNNSTDRAIVRLVNHRPMLLREQTSRCLQSLVSCHESKQGRNNRFPRPDGLITNARHAAALARLVPASIILRPCFSMRPYRTAGGPRREK